MSRENDGRKTTYDYRRYVIDARDWSRRGMLTPNAEETEVTYPRRDRRIGYGVVGLAWTACNFGGWRVWFICPKCERRVSVLFSAYDLGCRHCYDLKYLSQQENISDRAIRRVNKLRKRLLWHPGFAFGEYGKPKAMHWNTFRRLVQEYRSALSEIIDW